jgi:hypothetical protein
MGTPDFGNATGCIAITDKRLLELDGPLGWNDLVRSYGLLIACPRCGCPLAGRDGGFSYE